MFADYIIKSDCIFDACSDKPFSGFVAVRDERISYIGKSEDEMLKYLGRNTRILVTTKKLVMPGFCESHAHVFYGALEVAGANVAESVSEEDAVNIIFEHEKDTDNEWIIAFGWNNEYWREKSLPTKASLDKVFPDRPVVVINEELHGAWVNSKALEICEINAETKIPEGMGLIGKDDCGEPTGYLLRDICYETGFGCCFFYAE